MLFYIAIFFVPALAAFFLQLLCYASYKKTVQSPPKLPTGVALQNV